MALDYQRRLTNLQNRRFDAELRESALTKTFSSKVLPENIRYLVESMKPIDQKYNQRTIDAAERVKNHLESGFDLHFSRAYRNQGSVRTNTNIKVHSDFDLLAIVDRYVYLHPELPNNNPYKDSLPDDDIQDLRRQAIDILKRTYDIVDDSGTKSISIFNKSLNRKIDVVFCFWFDTAKYLEANNEYYRGIYLYDFSVKQKIEDYPFAHMGQVNYKGDTTTDGSRRGIRLLKTLKADSDEDIDLSSFQLTSIVHSIENMSIRYETGREYNIAIEMSREMSKLIDDSEYRKAVKSPNQTENPLKNDECVAEIKKLKRDLDSLIQDSVKDFSNVLVQRELLYP